jgi:hypothetical protein
MAFHAAFYKAKGTLLDRVIRYWDNGPYSHCELVFQDGMSCSATNRDGMRVRGKYISYDNDSWDFIELPDDLEEAARRFFTLTDGAKYDLLGQVRFLFLSPFKGFKDKYWCSEWCAQALGMPEPWRHTPNSFRSAVELVRK